MKDQQYQVKQLVMEVLQQDHQQIQHLQVIHLITGIQLIHLKQYLILKIHQ